MGHVWLGFSDEHVRRLFQEAGFEEVRLVNFAGENFANRSFSVL